VGLIPSAAVALMLGLSSLAAAQTTMSESMTKEMLAAHNQVRAGVGLPPLKWSPTLAGVAQLWADELLASGMFQHPPPAPVR
jgi:uncharacterized protein YkwD